MRAPDLLCHVCSVVSISILFSSVTTAEYGSNCRTCKFRFSFVNYVEVVFHTRFVKQDLSGGLQW